MATSKRRALLLLFWSATVAGFLVPTHAHAERLTANALLPKVAAWSARFEAMLDRAVFTMSGYLEAVDDEGTVSSRREALLRVDDRGPRAHVFVLRYLEDGKDETAEARAKTQADERKRAGKPKDPEEELHLPFLAAEQPKYLFRIGETDPRAPTHVRVYFWARRPAQNLGNGSAWVDSATGAVLSLVVSPSRRLSFVDYLWVTLEFGESTAMGPGVSRARFESRGGILFFRTRVRGEAKFSGYEIR